MIKKTVTATPAQVAPSKVRAWLVIQNQGDDDIYVAFGEDSASLTGPSGAFPGILLEAGDSIAGDARRLSNAIWSVAPNSDQTISIDEG